MDTPLSEFVELRPRLLGLAYRMLGSLADAEDVVQDVWLAWQATKPSSVLDSTGWLITTTTRRAVDRLRRLAVEREHYAGIWLPEPILSMDVPSLEESQEAASDLSLAFLLMMERLAPDARAAFILREVIGADYSEIAKILGKTEVASRQIFHRAKQQLRDETPRYKISRHDHRRVIVKFAEAWAAADFKRIRSLLAHDSTLVGDGGGAVQSFPEPLEGAQRIAQLLFAPTLRTKDISLQLAKLNGRTGILRHMHGSLDSAHCFDTDGTQIVAIQTQRNPKKLSNISIGLSVHLS